MAGKGSPRCCSLNGGRLRHSLPNLFSVVHVTIRALHVTIQSGVASSPRQVLHGERRSALMSSSSIFRQSLPSIYSLSLFPQVLLTNSSLIFVPPTSFLNFFPPTHPSNSSLNFFSQTRPSNYFLNLFPQILLSTSFRVSSLNFFLHLSTSFSDLTHLLRSLHPRSPSPPLFFDVHFILSSSVRAPCGHNSYAAHGAIGEGRH